MARVMDGYIGRKVRQGRWTMGMPRGQLAKRIGMPIWQLDELERGNTSIRASCLHQIALALELPVSFFFPDAQGNASDVDEGRAEILTTEQALALVQSYYRIPPRQRQNLLHLGDMVDAIGYQPTGSAQGTA